MNAVSSSDLSRRHEPAPARSGHYEEKIETRRIEALRDSRPTLIPSTGRDRNRIPLVAVRGLTALGRGLDLNPDPLPAEIRDHINVRAMPEGKKHGSSLPRQPFDRRGLPEVALLPAIDQPFHPSDGRQADGRRTTLSRTIRPSVRNLLQSRHVRLTRTRTGRPEAARLSRRLRMRPSG